MGNKNEKFEFLGRIFWKDRYTNYSEQKLGKTCYVISTIILLLYAFLLAEDIF